MHVRTGSAAARPLSIGDALEELCFSDAVFAQRYEGWRVLGRGPWATVVKTRSRDLNQDIALKVFVNVDPELLDRVRHEVRAVMALATPYLVHTYSLFDRATIAWFEMELVEGPNLQQELDRLAAAGDRFPLVRAYEIALAVSRCVSPASRLARTTTCTASPPLSTPSSRAGNSPTTWPREVPSHPSEGANSQASPSRFVC